MKFRQIEIVDLVKRFPMSIWLQKAASIQPRTTDREIAKNEPPPPQNGSSERIEEPRLLAPHLLVDRRPGLGAEEPGHVAVVRFTLRHRSCWILFYATYLRGDTERRNKKLATTILETAHVLRIQIQFLK